MRRLRVFYLLTITQVLSIIGSMMTGIAVSIRVFTDTGDSTPVLMTSFFSALPMMVAGMFAGVLVDRWQRRAILMLSDAGQAVGAIVLIAVFSLGVFQLWHLYAVALVQGLLAMLQRPAMEASVTMLVPEDHRDRANAIRQMTGPAAGIIAPVVTGFLYPLVGVIGVMVIDLSAFVAAFIVLLVVRIPQPARTQEGQAAAGTMWAELGGAFRFLWQRRIMLVMMLYAAIYNFLLTGPMGLNTPYIITLTGSTATLGVLMGVLNVGIIAGGVIMSIWGGTRPRIHGIMLGLLFRSFWLAVYGIVRSPLTLGLALFFIFFTNALIDGSFLSLVQLKTPPDMQGRVFALLFQLMYIASPLSSLLTGPLVDSVLTPAVGTPAWQLVKPIVGDGPASGMGLLLATAGTILCIVTAVMYAWPRTRRMESELPNYRATV